MSLSLPLTGSVARSLFAIEDLVRIADPANRDKLVTLGQAKLNAHALMAADPAVKSVTMFVLAAAGDLRLIEIFSPESGRGWVQIWNFGML